MKLPIFPDFASLELEDKEEYNQLVSKFPPVSDIAFTTLHIWWNLEGKLAISSINGNLVLNYQLPFDPDNSGYCLIGDAQVDESINVIFEHLRRAHQPPKLVHVPEFVVEKIAKKDGLLIEEELDYHEYIMDSQALASLAGHEHSRTRRKVNRFLREVEDKSLEFRPLDLSADDTKKLLIDEISRWDEKYPGKNDPGHTEKTAIEKTLSQALALDTQNYCLFIDGQLHGVVLYHLSVDKKHFIINHLKVDYTYHHVFDYVTNQIAEAAHKQGVPYLNMEMDLGIEGLRQHKQGLRPVSFFKKYTVRSAG